MEILNAYREVNNLNYDCIIPVSGARDSFFIVDQIRNVFGMHPLLVNYNRHYNSPSGLYNISLLRTTFGCDLMTETLAPDLSRRISRATLEKLGSFHWPYIAGSTVFPVQVAIRMNIPLIIWGAHQGLDQVGMYSHLDNVEMTRQYRREHDLMGLEPEDMVGEIQSLSEQDLSPLFYPSDHELLRIGVRGIYLGNYVRWDTKEQHENMGKKYKYCWDEQGRTFDTYSDVDCQYYSSVHDYIKFIKFGFGKVTDHASREIRFGRLTREEGARLVDKFQFLRPANLREFLEYFDISERKFFSFLNPKRDPSFWTKIEMEKNRNFLNNVLVQKDRRVQKDRDFENPTKNHFNVHQPIGVQSECRKAPLLTRGYFKAE